MAFEERGQPSSVLSGYSTGSRLLDYIVERLEDWLTHKPTVKQRPKMIQMPSAIISDMDLEGMKMALGPFQIEASNHTTYTKILLPDLIVEPKSTAPAHKAIEPLFIKLTVRRNQLVALASRDSDVREVRFVLSKCHGGLDVSHVNDVVIAMDKKAAETLETPLAIKRSTTPQSVMFPMPTEDIVDPRRYFLLSDKEISRFEDQLTLREVLLGAQLPILKK